ncbi:hypothetical protein SK128_026076 [Halocaridina rubra]|uniref:Uncharacterized protein n=1 Tax=Halocaridina rubra TaxID=373956 RepID=A0AAN8XTP7_HALRR
MFFRSGSVLACISCDLALKNVTDAIEHTVVCRKKNRYVSKYEGVDQIKRNKGSVSWTRVNVGHLLKLLNKKASDLGKAKAHYRTYELGKVHDEIVSELQEVIGPGVTRYQVTRKWALLKKRALQYEEIHKKQDAEGIQPSDPPSFYPSVKEIMRRIDDEKMKYLKEMEHSEKRYLLKIKDHALEAPQELCSDKEKSHVPSDGDEETCKISHNEEGEPGSMVIKRNTVLRIINLLEEGFEYPEIMKEFDITDAVLAAIDQNKETISQGAQRCSLCHITLSTEDIVAHEIECCQLPQHLNIKDEDEQFMGFLPGTVKELVDIVLNWYPKFTKKVNWSKVSLHLSHMQAGVTPLRCSQKWHNLISRCRRYQRLDNWAKVNNCKHYNLPPDFYIRLIPYALNHRMPEPSQKSIQRFLSSGHCENSKLDPLSSQSFNKRRSIFEGCYKSKILTNMNDTDDDDDHYDDVDIPSSDALMSLDDTDDDNYEDHDTKRAPTSETTSYKFYSSKESLSTASLETCSKQRETSEKSSLEGLAHESTSTIEKTDRLLRVENKLEEVLGLLSNVVKENYRLKQETSKKYRWRNSGDIAGKLETLTQVFITTHHQHMKQLQTMAKMWERHHQEYQSTMKMLISRLSFKKTRDERIGVKRKKTRS